MSVSVSIITACYNSAQTIRDTIASVREQTYPHLEYIIVDGGSPDGTAAVCREALKGYSRPWDVISERDKGMYDAMAKGIARATGDVVAVLNADDRFEAPESVAKMAAAFSPDVQVLLADVVIADASLRKVIRYYSAASFQAKDLLRGIMPPHAGFYARRALFQEWGSYRHDYKYAGDFELITRFLLKHKVPFKHIPETIVRMRTGGLSNRSLRHRYELNREVLRGLRENGFPAGWLRLLSKIPGKLIQYWIRPPDSSRQ